MSEKFQEIPLDALSKEAREGVIKDFILREGTDYGEREYTLEEKIAHVEKQLERGSAKIVYDTTSETCSILSVRELQKLSL